MNPKSSSSFSKEDAIKALTSLGLSLGEAKTYSSLAGMGPIHATTLAGLAKVPQPKIYGYLESLVQKTFVTRQSKKGIPDSYMAVPYELVIETLENELQTKIKAANRYFEQVKETERKRDVEDLFSYFEGERAVFAGLKTIFDTVQKNVMIVLINSEDESMIKKFLEERKQKVPDLEILQLEPSDRLQKVPPIKKLLNTEGFQELLNKRPTMFYVDVDFEKNVSSSMNLVLPPIEKFSQALINIKHPIALQMQVQLFSGLLDSLKTIGMKTREL